ncbi:hypothetical protein BBJ28_00024972, partial [Nothophytophthora sp. Chile5]
CMRVGVAESAFPVEIDSAATIGDLKEAIAAECQSTAPPCLLQLFLAKRGESDWLSNESDEGNALEEGNAEPVRDLLQRPLKPMKAIDDVFAAIPPKDALHVLVRVALDRQSIQKRRHWVVRQSNGADVDNRNKRAKKSAAYSSLTFEVVKDIYEPAFDGKYLQAVKPLPKKTLDLLENIFEMKQASYGAVITGSEAKRLHFIEPILLIVANLLEPSIKIEIEEAVNGNCVNVNGNLTVVLKRKLKTGGYGGRERTFMKRSDEQIGVDEDSVGFGKGVRSEVSRIAGKVYSILVSD